MDIFDAVYGESEGFVQVVTGSFGDDNKLSVKTADFFEWPVERDTIAKVVADAADRDVYLCTSLLSKRRRSVDTVTNTHVIAVDADSCVPSNFRVAPSLVVETSPDRYHAYWLLDDAVTAQEASDVARRICIAHQHQGCDKSGWPTAKLLRVPGTWNTKRDAPVKETNAGSGEVYAIQELIDAYSDVVVSGPRVTVSADMPKPSELPSLLPLVNRLDHELLTFYRLVPKQDADWSNTMWRFIQDAFRFGFDRIEVFTLARETQFNKYARDKRPAKLLWAEVLKGESEYETTKPTDVPQIAETLVAFLRTDEREDISECFIDSFEEWVHSRSPLASRKYSRFVAFMVLANVYGAWVHITPKIGDMKLNLWGLLLGPSSSTKKTTVVNLGLSLLRAWEARLPDEQRGFDVGSDFTPEGLNIALSQRDGLVSFVHRDEISGFFQEMFTKSYLAGGVQRMTALYDGHVLKTMRAGRNASQQNDAETVFNFLGLGIEQHTASTLNTGHFQSGFLPRFLWCVEDEPEWTEDRELVLQQSAEETKTIDENINIMCNQFSLARRKWDHWSLSGSVPIRMSDDALARMNEFTIDSKRAIMGRDDETLIEPSRLRLVWSVWKCAALLAVHEGADQIELKHLMYVLRESEVWFNDMIRVAAKVAESDFATSVNELEAYIATQNKAVDSSAIYRKFSSYRKGEVDELLLSLIAQGRIKADSGQYKAKGPLDAH